MARRTTKRSYPWGAKAPRSELSRCCAAVRQRLDQTETAALGNFLPNMITTGHVAHQLIQVAEFTARNGLRANGAGVATEGETVLGACDALNCAVKVLTEERAEPFSSRYGHFVNSMRALIEIAEGGLASGIKSTGTAGSEAHWEEIRSLSRQNKKSRRRRP